jgi:hypothetical protein
MMMYVGEYPKGQRNGKGTMYRRNQSVITDVIM